jgi:carbamoyl-phosphate synthase small subunit
LENFVRLNQKDPIKTMPEGTNALLLLADGSVFFGKGIGFEGTSTGEICFNTSITGYQEILTDPSYCGQIITFTFPHIGNIGTNDEDIESSIPYAKGLILQSDITEPANFRSSMHLNDWLVKHKITGISGIDTRALTRHVRTNGAQNALICYRKSGKFDIPALLAQLVKLPSFAGQELTCSVSRKSAATWKESKWNLGSGYGSLSKTRHKVVAIDYGAKLNILRCLVSQGCDVTVVPATTSFEEIMRLQPDGVFLSNGPGDPAATGKFAIPVIQKIIESGIPLFGICLGHQLLSLALGASTEKMHQGHRGANHPVKNLLTGKVEITSQNHGFVVTKDSLPKGVSITHISLFDNTIEGIQLDGKPVFSVQHHPESSPGPHDSHYLFDTFIRHMDEYKQQAHNGLRKNA